MVTAAEIRDEASLRAWLEGQPREVAVWLANRAAMRVAPIAWAAPVFDEASGQDTTSLPVFRALLATVVAQNFPDIDAGLHSARQSVAEVVHVFDLFMQGRRGGTIGDKSSGDVARAACHAADAAILKPPRTSYLPQSYHTGYAVAAADLAANQTISNWTQARDDALAIEQDAQLQRIWSGTNPILPAWAEAMARWEKDGDFWHFWINWYDDALAGREPDWDLLKEVALIPDAVWSQGVEAVAEEIGRIEAEHGSRPSGQRELKQALSAMTAGSDADVARVQCAFVTHRAELPPTFDAVLGVISLEIERLQTRNYRDEGDAAEAKRQIGVLTTLHRAVAALKALVPETGAMSDADAVEAEKLSRLYVRKFQEWPRANADELVDSAYRIALVGATTVMLPMIGITAPYAFAAGLVLFKGKQMADAVRLAREAITS